MEINMKYNIVQPDFELPPEGLHLAVVYAWEDKGMQLTQYGEKHRAIIKYESLIPMCCFELPAPTTSTRVERPEGRRRLPPAIKLGAVKTATLRKNK